MQQRRHFNPAVGFGVAIALVALILLGGIHFGRQIPIKRKYEAARESFTTPVYSRQPMDQTVVALLDTARTTWITKDPTDRSHLQDLLPSIGLEASVEGLVDLFTHEMAPYSFFDSRRNKREAIIGQTLVVLATISVDGKIHCMDGLACVRLTEDVIQVYEDTSSGLTSQMYWKPKSSEPPR